MKYILCRKELYREENNSGQATGWTIRGFIPARALRFTKRPSQCVPGLFPRGILRPTREVNFSSYILSYRARTPFRFAAHSRVTFSASDLIHFFEVQFRAC
jgi:hypothetical protein